MDEPLFKLSVGDCNVHAGLNGNAPASVDFSVRSIGLQDVSSYGRSLSNMGTICRPPPSGCVWRRSAPFRLMRLAFEAWWGLHSAASARRAQSGGRPPLPAFFTAPLPKSSAQAHGHLVFDASRVELSYSCSLVSLLLSRNSVAESLRLVTQLKGLGLGGPGRAPPPQRRGPAGPRRVFQLSGELGVLHVRLAEKTTVFASVLGCGVSCGYNFVRCRAHNILVPIPELSFGMDDFRVTDILNIRYRHVIQPREPAEMCRFRLTFARHSEDLSPDTPIQRSILRAELNSAHVTLCGRFLKDLIAFLSGITHVVKEGAARPPVAPPAPGASAAPRRPPTLVLIHANDVQVSLPRCSWADELFTLRASRIAVQLPAHADHVSAISHSRMTSAKWPTVSISSPCGGCGGPSAPLSRAPEDREALECLRQLRFAHSEIFHTFDEGQSGPLLVAISASSLSAYWAIHEGKGPSAPVSEQRVLSGSGDLLTTIRLAPGCPKHVLVQWPSLRSTFGEAQYALLMGIIFQNMAEPGTFKAFAGPPPPPGTPPVCPPPPPPTLGISSDDRKTFELRIEIPEAFIFVEGQDPRGVLTGSGPPVASVKMRKLVVLIQRHESTYVAGGAGHPPFRFSPSGLL